MHRFLRRHGGRIQIIISFQKAKKQNFLAFLLQTGEAEDVAPSNPVTWTKKGTAPNAFYRI